MNKKNKRHNKSPAKIANNAVERSSEAGGAIGGTIAGGITGAGIGAATALATGGTATPLIKEGAKAGADLGANVGKEAGKVAGKGFGIDKKLQKVASDPITYIVDAGLKLVIDFLCPIPIVGEYAGDFFVKYKGQILFALLGISLMMCSFLSGSINNTFAENISELDSHISELPHELEGYQENGFQLTNNPNKSPLGGDCKDYSIITAYFYDPNYYQKFGRWHKALDIIPSQEYYSSNKAYQLTHEIVVFATMNGRTEFGIDDNGALIAKIVNGNSNLEVGYAHLKTSYVQTDDYVNAGDPIGIMGNTGLGTGVHLHYWIAKIKCEGCWPEAYDPYPQTFGWCS
ncbi:M23 family metallopeptidase [Candidatus Dojkabacteria bacterium]|nr:M23 family metallopeptidase [Candidatus Dojkabacteria bacterium]